MVKFVSIEPYPPVPLIRLRSKLLEYDRSKSIMPPNGLFLNGNDLLQFTGPIVDDLPGVIRTSRVEYVDPIKPLAVMIEGLADNVALVPSK